MVRIIIIIITIFHYLINKILLKMKPENLNTATSKLKPGQQKNRQESKTKIKHSKHQAEQHRYKGLSNRTENNMQDNTLNRQIQSGKGNKIFRAMDTLLGYRIYSIIKNVIKTNWRERL